MNLANEAGYLYVYSKKLMKLSKTLKYLSHHAEKHLKKHQSTNDANKKQKHYHKHLTKKEEITKIVKEREDIFKKMRHHEVAFRHALEKEHHLKQY
ncbi:MAG: hypothetical protein ABIG93_05170 [archaeon]|nr:hypothetical protein [Nanoarchaeota archaeon]